ncbi:MAG: glycosyltransferase family 2 protein, partial [Bacteroidota bacterium]|nr:glycosyltransferase family 2 protein [Bacteroidota bacterium]
MPKLSIIVPAYNEGPTIHIILEKLNSVELTGSVTKELIIVNDCSRDDTAGRIEEFISKHPELDVKLISHDVNKGKGAALHTGIRHATGEFLIIQDADLEYDPQEFNILLQPVLAGVADVVYGSRFAGGNA